MAQIDQSENPGKDVVCLVLAWYVFVLMDSVATVQL